jgi:hypothetical protein
MHNHEDDGSQVSFNLKCKSKSLTPTGSPKKSYKNAIDSFVAV